MTDQPKPRSGLSPGAEAFRKQIRMPGKSHPAPAGANAFRRAREQQESPTTVAMLRHIRMPRTGNPPSPGVNAFKRGRTQGSKTPTPPKRGAEATGQPLRFTRAPIARGLAAAPARSTGTSTLSGIAVVTRGEALGHDIWLDDAFLDSLVTAMNAPGSKGVKCRFTHPSLSADGLGTYLGRIRNGRRDGDIVRGDLEIAQSSHSAPDGDLGAYVRKLAAEDPEAFGTSIVFERDAQAEESFLIDHGADPNRRDPWGELSSDGFRSPERGNTRHLRHARLKALRACDVVDEPAANPSGLFARGHEIAREADGVLQYAFGLSSRKPTTTALDVDPDRARAFVQRFLSRRNLTLVPKD